jgi:hypothetical protein
MPSSVMPHDSELVVGNMEPAVLRTKESRCPTVRRGFPARALQSSMMEVSAAHSRLTFGRMQLVELYHYPSLVCKGRRKVGAFSKIADRRVLPTKEGHMVPEAS